MMKVGILTVVRVVNYGTFLQAYALQDAVRQLGHECSFLGYSHGHAPGAKMHERHTGRMLARARRLLRNPHLRTRWLNLQKSGCFRRYVDAYLNLSNQSISDCDCDVVVVGSDEVWNFLNSPIGYEPAFFGQGNAQARLVAYAPSFGFAAIEDIESHGLGGPITAGLKSFTALSSRDRNTQAIIEQLMGTTVPMVLDPTLAFGRYDALTQATDLSNYILVYAYGTHPNRDEISSLRDFARYTAKKLVSVGIFHDWCDININADPRAFLALYKAADYVVSSTYHGTIFAIMNRKPFCSLVGVNRNKLGFLLSDLGLSDRIAQAPSGIEAILMRDPDYQMVASRLDTRMELSRSYLRGAIEGDGSL